MALTARRYATDSGARADLRDRVGRLEGASELILATLGEMREDRQRGEDRILASIHEIKATVAGGLHEQDERLRRLEIAGGAASGARQARRGIHEHLRAWRTSLVVAGIGFAGALAGAAIIAVVTIWSTLR